MSLLILALAAWLVSPSTVRAQTRDDDRPRERGTIAIDDA